ncbi:protein sey1 [Anaeramoeba flamelloides]|uniref:Protein sey1 n=1 Tax=Anaeramoeba flamelloides TaxID=1746091 RepID=A0ABQ8XG09_9EUKA|nr:protein sey1 [Anaeramoeba flamelloides]
MEKTKNKKIPKIQEIKTNNSKENKKQSSKKVDGTEINLPIQILKQDIHKFEKDNEKEKEKEKEKENKIDIEIEIEIEKENGNDKENIKQKEKTYEKQSIEQNPKVQPYFICPKTETKIYNLFYYIEGSEYDDSHILLPNTKAIIKFVTAMKTNANYDEDEINPKPISCVGFYGEKDLVELCLRSYFGIDQLTLPTFHQRKKQKHLVTDQILSITRNDKIALVYLDQNKFQKKPFETGNIATTMIRYLIDICPTITVCMSNDTIHNWFYLSNEELLEIQSQNKKKYGIKKKILKHPNEPIVHDGGKITYKKVKMNEDVDLQKVTVLPCRDLNFNNAKNIVNITFELFPDQSEYIWKKIESFEIIEEPIRHQIALKLFEIKSYLNNFYYSKRGIDSQKGFTYKECKKKVLENWTNRYSDLYKKNEKEYKLWHSFKQRIKTIFEKFIDKENISKFKDLINDTVEFFLIDQKTRREYLEQLEILKKLSKEPKKSKKERFISYWTLNPYEEIPYNYNKREEDLDYYYDQNNRNDIKQQKEDIQKKIRNLSEIMKDICPRRILETFFTNLEKIIISKNTLKKKQIEYQRFKIHITKKDQGNKQSIQNIRIDRVSGNFQLDEMKKYEDIKITQILQNTKDPNPKKQRSFIIMESKKTNNRHYYSQIKETEKRRDYAFSYAPFTRDKGFDYLFSFSSKGGLFKIDHSSNLGFYADNIHKKFSSGTYTSHDFSTFSNHYIYKGTSKYGLIEEIVSFTFIPQTTDQLIILDQNGNLYEYRMISKSLVKIVKKDNVEDKIVKKPIKPKNEKGEVVGKYCEIQTNNNGKIIFLRYDNKWIDIYDLNWNYLNRIELTQDFYKFKIMNNGINNFILISTLDGKMQASHFIGMTESEEFNISKQSIEECPGNPFFDVLFLSYKKFGPNATIFGCSDETTLNIFTNNVLDKKKAINIKRYFNLLKLHDITLNKFFNKKTFKKENKFFQKINKNLECENKLINIINLILTRGCLHITTIRESTLFPLNEGQDISNKIFDLKGNKQMLVHSIPKLLSFGILEHVIKNSEKGFDRIIVISIVGRQSSGKSYLLNRLFGTRFGVASTRCTDGTWMGISILNRILFIIFDCEGLFSISRTETEEMKLLLGLSAVSDLLIINQDLTFSKYLDSLFNNLLNSKGRLGSGNYLFKGSLMMVIRDVPHGENEGAIRELSNYVKNLSNKGRIEFIQELFNNLKNNKIAKETEIQFQCLHNFENKDFFSTEIQQLLYENFILLNSHWTNGNTFIKQLKLVIAKIFSDDDTNIDEHDFRIESNDLIQKMYQLWENGGILEDNEIGWEIENKVTLKFEKKNYQITFFDKDLVFHGIINHLFNSNDKDYDEGDDDDEGDEVDEDDDDDDNDDDIDNEDEGIDDEKEEYNKEDDIINNTDLINYFENIFPIKRNQRNFNKWYKCCNHFIQLFLNRREQNSINWLKKGLQQFTQFDKQINILIQEIQNNFKKISNDYKLCLKKCNDCNLVCVKLENHLFYRSHNKKNKKGNKSALICDCKTDHKCKELCMCDDGNYCGENAGHVGQHYCREGLHKCKHECEFNCGNTCQFELNHKLPDYHRCSNLHKCKENCVLYPVCKNKCYFDLSEKHERHVCDQNNGCPFKCILCNEKCSSKDHFHDLDPNIKKIVDPKNPKEKIKLHLCDNEHVCTLNCENEGICQIDYENEEKEWENSVTSFTYRYMKPISQILKCTIPIPAGKYQHEGKHDCNRKHRCPNQCPECKSFCSLDIDHTGYHYCNNHRNKEFSMFVSKNKNQIIEFKDEKEEVRKYKVGELSKPEICSISCKRRGRGHYHLKECPGGEKCAELLHPKYVRHSNQSYYPNTEKKYDMWLCKPYWNSFHWESPVSNDKELETQIGLCNFYCPSKLHSEGPKVFCSNRAWHSLSPNYDEHSFDCEHPMIDTILLDVVFVCDTTGSMGSYITNAKTAIKRIINEGLTELNKLGTSKENIRFAFVAYKDHPPQDKTYVTKIQPFDQTNKVLQFIDGLKATGGGDAAESVLDGLEAACNLNWRQSTKRKAVQKIIIHILDAPPHGKRYGSSGDGFPDGCPCGLTAESVLTKMKKNEITLVIMKATSSINLMIKIFKEIYPQGVLEMNLNDAYALPVVTCSSICKVLEDNEITITLKKK